MLFRQWNLKGRALQYVALCSGACVILSDGLQLGWPAPYLPLLLSGQSAFRITDEDGSWIAISNMIGGFLGAVVSWLTLDVCGRKPLVVFTCIPHVVSLLMLAYAGSTWQLCVARVIGGVSGGIGFCTVPLYLSEIADANVRGFFVSSLDLIHKLGILVVSIAGTHISMATFSFVALSIPAFVFLTFLWMPETPHYYALKGEWESSRRSLEKISGKTDVEDRLCHISATVAEFHQSKGTFVEFLTNRVSRRGIYALLVLRGVQQFSGIIAITFYLPVILESAKDFVSPNASTAVYYSLQILTTCATTVAIDHLGRKPLLLISVTVTSVALCIVGVYFSVAHWTNINLDGCSWIPLLGLFLFIAGYSSGLNCIPVLLVGELFPIGVKVLAATVFDMYFCIMSSLASKFFQYTKDAFGMYVPFLTFAACCICSLPVIMHLVSETKNKTLEEIQTESKSMKS
ncbi:facilitated trehalose transporter Tret1-like [Photinus pyralis]|uniref:facilitated trehalose transporter Tret1-like n=1 Tax=Photinus pyralis TaxID=7054 RepID=UPI0012670C1F|nr:facilitated trehalose transporter Tret1-like [Photinus pyralis]XP_031357627.1 facilitated trehalose transporter Tret1-like [Photinus pyralis]